MSQQIEEGYKAATSDKFAVAEKLRHKQVLITSESLGPINGVTRATQNLLEYLWAQNIKVAALAPAFQQPDNLPLRTKLPVIRVGGYPLLYNPDLRIAYPFRMSKVFHRTFRPDVIYLASPASLGFMAWWQLRRSGIPLIANFQTDLGAYARTMLPKLLQTPAGWGVDRMTGWYYRDAGIKAVLVPASASSDYLLSLGVAAEKMHLVGRGVDNIFFNPAKRTAEMRQELAPNNEIVLLCVSRVSYEKGFEFLAEVFATITAKARERGITRPLKLVVTGGNSNQSIMNDIKSYFFKRNLNVLFTGARSGEPLAQTYASGDIFVYPSLTETFGQVIQEALSSGVPVVARREGGPADIVEPGVTGYLPDPQNIDQFAENVLTLVQDEALRHRMSLAARAFAETRSWDAINQQISQIMANCLP